LQLNDFPGQGTSPVGVVDVFFDPKVYTDAEEFRRMQSPQIPLLRTDKFTWSANEHFVADAQFVNFGKEELKNARIRWTLKSQEGQIISEGVFSPVDIPLGIVITAGELSVPLSDIRQATALDVVLSLEGTDIYNQWMIWVYPSKLPEPKPENLLVTRVWDKKAKQHLEKGGNVFLLADTAKIDSDVLPCFSGISWNAVWSGMPPNLLGILCNPAHDALNHFPTQFHSNWQWFDMVRFSRPMLLDHTPLSFKPLIQIIPDWNNNRKIGLIFDANIGKGKLMMTSIDLLGIMNDSPVARQMYYSLMEYMASDSFKPEHTLSFEMIDKIFK
jgi:hypothetical protein